MVRHSQIRTICLIPLIIGLAIESHFGFAAGGIVTDGSVGNTTTDSKLTGSKLVIPESLGERRGGNLFLSFKEFNINNGQTVTFTEKVTKSTENVITRVTGRFGTDINGTLSVTPKGKANSYLINPYGVTFGPGGQVDVPGSIHISTADQLKFKDGKIFSAVNPTGNSLSSVAPAAFGFLGTSKGNNGLLKIDSAILNIKDKREENPNSKEINVFDAVAGQITITDKNKEGFNQNINGTNGEVRLVASHGAAEISVEPDVNGNLTIPSIKPNRRNAGDIQIKNALVTLRGDGGGRIDIWGRNLTITDSGALHVTNTGSSNPGKEKGISIKSNSLLVKTNGFIESINEFL